MDGILARVFVWFSILQTAVMQESFCASKDQVILKFCHMRSVTAAVVYLDSAGFPVDAIGECLCKINSPKDAVSINISAIPFSKEGRFELEVDGKQVTTPAQLQYVSGMQVVLRQTSAAKVVQCLKIIGEMNSTEVPLLNVQCVKRDMGLSTGTTDKINKDDGSDTGRAEKTKGDDESNIGVIAGAAAGGFVVIVGVLVAVIICKRKRNKRFANQQPELAGNNQKENDPEYDMTVNAGYLSGDDVDSITNKCVPPGRVYQNIVQKEAEAKAFSAQIHDASGYTIVSKAGKEGTINGAEQTEENVYDHTNEEVVQATGHIYGVATPINPTF